MRAAINVGYQIAWAGVALDGRGKGSPVAALQKVDGDVTVTKQRDFVAR